MEWIGLEAKAAHVLERRKWLGGFLYEKTRCEDVLSKKPSDNALMACYQHLFPLAGQTKVVAELLF